MIRTCKKDFFTRDYFSPDFNTEISKGLVVLCQKVGFSIDMTLKLFLRGNKL